MLALGLNDDLYEGGVTLSDGDKVLFAANEERYTRNKNQGGFPFQTLQGMFRYTGVKPSDIGQICMSGIMTPPLPKRIVPDVHKWLDSTKKEDPDSFNKKLLNFLIYRTPISHTTPGTLIPRMVKPLLPYIIRRILPKELRTVPIQIVEHHPCHAASAWYLSGLGDALAITGDGMGDGLSLTVSRCSEPGRIERIWQASSRDSFGLFFELITEAFGFIPCRHEGKVTGLAAMGDPDKVDVPSPFSLVDGELKYDGPYGREGVEWAKRVLVSRYAREDISAWAQAQLEENVVAIAERWLRETGLRKIVVAGGIFANVKLNQKLHQLDEVDELFVCPNMGDGGLSLGALCAGGFVSPHAVGDVFLGEDFSEKRIESAIKQAGFAYERCDDIEERIADAVLDEKLVARFEGRMEWGPRALGNRSVLAKTTNRQVVERLNKLLKRNDFMPFAPACLEEDMDELFFGVDAARHASEFMTACFNCTDKMIREHPAVVHVDDTARTQLVREETNPHFYRILTAYKRRSGHGILLNTSFNVHEQPIVHTPEEAIDNFVNAGLDYLAMGPFLVPAAHMQRSEEDRSQAAASSGVAAAGGPR